MTAKRSRLKSSSIKSISVNQRLGRQLFILLILGLVVYLIVDFFMEIGGL